MVVPTVRNVEFADDAALASFIKFAKPFRGFGHGSKATACEGKRSFDDYSLVCKAAGRRKRRQVYRCRFCRAWHVGDEGVIQLKRLDEKLIDLTQDAYLWLYDRTGIYLATVAVCISLFTTSFREYSVRNLVGTAIFAASLIPYYIRQDRRAFGEFNAISRFLRENMVRPFYIAAFVYLAVSSETWAKGVDFAACGFVVGYLMTVQIRDREPKDLFPSPKMLVATSAQ